MNAAHLKKVESNHGRNSDYTVRDDGEQFPLAPIAPHTLVRILNSRNFDFTSVFFNCHQTKFIGAVINFCFIGIRKK
jgi:hypothetical protein